MNATRSRTTLVVLPLLAMLAAAPASASQDGTDPEFRQLMDAGRYAAAAAAARERVAALAADQETAPTTLAEALADLGEACNALALPDSARAVLEEALSLRAGPDLPRDPATLRVLVELARAEEGAKQADEAAAWSQEAVALADELMGEQSAESAVTRLRLVAHLRLAAARRQQGAFEEATRLCLEAGEGIAATVGQPSRESIEAQVLLAACYNDVGRYDEGLAASREAVVQARELHAAAHPQLAETLATLSFTHWRRADYVSAEELQREALAMRLQFFPRASDPVMECYATLGLILNSDTRYEDSLEPHREAIAIGRTIYPGDHLNLAYMLNNYGLALQNLHRLEESEAALREAYEMMERLGRGDDPGVTYMIQNLAGIAMYRDRDDRAAELWAEVERRHRRQRGESFEGVATARGALGTIAYRQGDVTRARDWYLEAARSYDLGRLRAGRGIASAAFWPSPYEKLASLEVELGRDEAAWVALEKARSRTLADVLWSSQVRVLDAGEVAEEEALRSALVTAIDHEAELARQAAADPDSSAALARAETEVLAARNRWDAFEREMAARYPASEENILPLDRVRAALPPDAALVGWLDVRLARPAPTRWAYVIRPAQDIVWVRLRDGRVEITDRNLWIKPRDLRLAIVPERPSPLGLGPESERAQLAARLLHEQWVEPILAHLAGVKHLIAVPSTSLAGAPLEAFVDADGIGLGERFAISYAPSATLHAWLVERRGDERSFRRDGLLVADPPFRPEHAGAPVDSVAPILLSSLEATVLRDALGADPAALASLPRLSWSRREADAVAGAFPRSDRIVGLEASELTLRDLANGGHLADYRFLHFATHALVDAESPERSALVLSQLGAREGAAEGLLTAAEIARDWSLEADLVTLSACETALGREVVGEGVVGFSYPLLEAGARCLLLSLWPVDDRATALLMERFYAVWAGGERSLDEALQDAKRWLRDYRDPSGAQPYAHPFYWSSFVLIGAAT